MPWLLRATGAVTAMTALKWAGAILLRAGRNGGDAVLQWLKAAGMDERRASEVVALLYASALVLVGGRLLRRPRAGLLVAAALVCGVLALLSVVVRGGDLFKSRIRAKL